jgi:Protein of unknown function (DUF2510)
VQILKQPAGAGDHVFTASTVPCAHRLAAVSAKAGWYPDPGGGQGLYRYWDGKSWSAATSPNPGAPPPTQGLASIGQPASGSTVGQAGGTLGQTGTSYGQASGGFGPGSGFAPGSGFGSGSQPAYGAGNPTAYANYQQIQKKKSPVGWWIAGAALVVVIVVVAVIAIRAVAGGNTGIATPGGGPASQDTCPPKKTETADPNADPNDGRVHGGPLSYPTLGSPWGPPVPDDRVPFGTDVLSQLVVVEPNYAPDSNWVASVLVGELQAGDGFFTPEQGSQIVVKCILGAFYGNAAVGSDVKKNEAITIDGHEGWIVESHLTFDIPGLKTKGEQLIVVIVSAGARSGLYYASIPDTTPELLKPARDLIKQLKVTE